jgi:hypothetical protein
MVVATLHLPASPPPADDHLILPTRQTLLSLICYVATSEPACEASWLHSGYGIDSWLYQRQWVGRLRFSKRDACIGFSLYCCRDVGSAQKCSICYSFVRRTAGHVSCRFSSCGDEGVAKPPRDSCQSEMMWRFFLHEGLFQGLTAHPEIPHLISNSDSNRLHSRFSGNRRRWAVMLLVESRQRFSHRML